MADASLKPRLPNPRHFALPVKDALRTLRFSVRKAQHEAPRPDLDGIPCGPLVARLFRGADHVASAAIDGASFVARSILEGQGSAALRLPRPLGPLLRDPASSDAATEVAFADAAHDALGQSLLQFGASDGLIIEGRLRLAYRAALREGRRARSHPAAVFAGTFVAEIIARGAIADVVMDTGETAAGGAPDAAAIGEQAAVALGLALVAASDPQAGTDSPADLLAGATDLAEALEEDIRRAGRSRRRQIQLLETYGTRI